MSTGTPDTPQPESSLPTGVPVTETVDTGTPVAGTEGAGAPSTGIPAGRAESSAAGIPGPALAPRAVRFRPAGLALTVVGVLLALPLVAAGAWALIMHSVGTWHHTAHTETVAPVVSLVSDGAVEIVVDPGATQVSVQADAWYAWGWQAPTYRATTIGDRLEIRHECGSFPVGPSCEAGLTVVLPSDTQLEVRAGNGPIVASDLTGPVDVASGDGRIELSRIDGDVVAHSGNGRVEVTDVAGSATVSSNDGAVVVSGVDGDVVEARSGNGRVEVSDVTGSATVSSSDGKVVVSGIGGDLIEARSGNGSVEVSQVHGSATVSSNDGSVVVNRVDGDVDARSGNGRVEVVGVVGSVTATSNDGAILVEDVLGEITARSGNGAVTVYGTGVPVALDISSGNGRQTIEAATDPTAPISVTIHSNDGGVSYLSPRAPSGVTPVVPDVVGMTQPEALVALQNAGLGIEIVAESSADVPTGLVLRTDPLAGQRVARGTVITVVVAAGEGS